MAGDQGTAGHPTPGVRNGKRGWNRGWSGRGVLASIAHISKFLSSNQSMKSLFLAMLGCSLGVHNPRESCFFPNCEPLGMGGMRLHNQGVNFSGLSRNVSRVQPSLFPKLVFGGLVVQGWGNEQFGAAKVVFGVAGAEQWVMGRSTCGLVKGSGLDSGWRWVVSLAKSGGEVATRADSYPWFFVFPEADVKSLSIWRLN